MSGSHSVSPSDFALLCDVIASVARHSGLPGDEAQDFSQHVHLRLLEKNYAPLAMFAGQSSFRTYLTVVVNRLLLDWRNARYGKWRPSAAAERLGPVAVDLDRLITRDGHDVDQAVNIMTGWPGAPAPDALRAIAEQLPSRVKVRAVAVDDLEPLHVGAFADPVEAEQDAAAKQQLVRALKRACRSLSEADRYLLFLRFSRQMAVPAIAEVLGEPAKPLYRRLDRIFATLRRQMSGQGQASRLHLTEHVTTESGVH
ncbi:MAG: sigma-70 family RNA polymerase sigma factor [Vicinamibacterales bacterium]